MKLWKLLLVILFIVLGIVGNTDYREAAGQQENYCEMVKSGKWPPFNQSVECEVP